MKKILVFLLAVVFSLTLAGAAFAADFADMYDLYQHWQMSVIEMDKSPYPDYVCGVWVEDGGATWVVAVTKDEAGEAGKQEILEQLTDSSNLKFTYQSYSYAELWELYQSIIPEMGEKSGIIGAGIYERENYIGLDYDVNNPNSEEYVKSLAKQYGDMVSFNASDGYDLYEETTVNTSEIFDRGMGETEKKSNTSVLLVLLCCVIAVMLGAVAFAAGRRRVKVFAEGDAANSASVKQQITANTETPPDALFEKIRRSIEDEQK